MRIGLRIALAAGALLALALGLAWRVVARASGPPEHPAAATLAAARSDSAELAVGEGAPARLRTLADTERLWTRAELEEALAALEPLAAPDRHDPGAHALASEVLRRLGHTDRALEHARAAVRLAPHRAEAHYLLAKALARKMQEAGMLWAMRNLGAYKDEMQAAVDLDPSNARVRMEQAAFYAVVPSLAGGDRQRARALADELEAFDPARAECVRVMCQASEGNLEGALERGQAALDRNPGSDELRLVLAGVYREAGRSEEALATYRERLRGAHDAGWFQAAYPYAKELVLSGTDLEEAERILAEYAARAPVGVDLLPPAAGAHWRRGQALEGLGRRSEAAAAYQAALELDPDFEEARTSLAALSPREGGSE